MKNIFLTLLLIPTLLFSQENSTGKVKFYIIPQTAKVKVDGKPIYKMGLPEEYSKGKHIVEICTESNLFQPLTDTIEVFDDSILVYRNRLTKSAAYQEFVKEFKEFRQVRAGEIALKTTIIVFNVGLTASLLSIIPKVKKYQNRLDASKYTYETSIIQANIDAAKANYNRDKDLYNEQVKKRKVFLSWSIPTIALSYSLSALFWSKIRKAGKKPKFEQKPLLCRMQFDLSIDPVNLKSPLFYYSFRF